MLASHHQVHDMTMRVLEVIHMPRAQLVRRRSSSPPFRALPTLPRARSPPPSSLIVPSPSPSSCNQSCDHSCDHRPWPASPAGLRRAGLPRGRGGGTADRPEGRVGQPAGGSGRRVGLEGPAGKPPGGGRARGRRHGGLQARGRRTERSRREGMKREGGTARRGRGERVHPSRAARVSIGLPLNGLARASASPPLPNYPCIPPAARSFSFRPPLRAAPPSTRSRCLPSTTASAAACSAPGQG